MNCRHCEGPLSLKFLDLDSAPPSNAYLSKEALNAPELWYPLRLLVCSECWLVQTEDYAARAQLFSADYAYFSSFSASWLTHSKSYVQTMRERFGLHGGSLVAEVAANDGYLLQFVRQAGIPCYGIEPTKGTAEAARAKGIEIIEEFFGQALADSLARAGRQVDLLAANNVLAHVPAINDFVAGFTRLLKPSGVATFEFPHLLSMVRECQFDTAYHEHYSYLSLTTVRRVFKAAGLDIFDVERLPTHGGSLRVYAQRAQCGPHSHTVHVEVLLNEEREAGMESPGFYNGFQQRAVEIKHALLAFLLEAKRSGRRVGAYGAAAKGNTLLNFAGVRPDLLPYVVDRNPAKQGTFLPGSRIPVVAEEHLRKARPDLILILPWNLRDEVVDQLHYVRGWGACFATAVPELRVVP